VATRCAGAALLILLVAPVEFGFERGDEQAPEGDLVVGGADAGAFEELVGVLNGGLGHWLGGRLAQSR
jgi:hypothetical protein